MNATTKTVEAGLSDLLGYLTTARTVLSAVIYPDPDGPIRTSERTTKKCTRLLRDVELSLARLDVHHDWVVDSGSLGGVNLCAASQSLEHHILVAGRHLDQLIRMASPDRDDMPEIAAAVAAREELAEPFAAIATAQEEARQLAESLYHD
jgi:hypothetical protein